MVLCSMEVEISDGRNVSTRERGSSEGNQCCIWEHKELSCVLRRAFRVVLKMSSVSEKSRI